MNLFSGKGLAGVKRALSRFWALFIRHTWKLLGSGALAAASGLVYALGVYISVDTHALLQLLLAVLLQLAYWAFLVLSAPESLVLFLLLNVWAPTVVVLMLLFDPLADTFLQSED